MSILKQIISSKKIFLKNRKKDLPLVELRSLLSPKLLAPRFSKTLRAKGIHLIAELKKASPSRGLISRDFDIPKIVKSYEKGGAACLSVLTDEKFFKGHLSYLAQARALTDLPLLRKDFIIDDYQVYESKVFGADAILLIAAALDKNRLKDLLNLARQLKLDIVCEVHNSRELDKVLNVGADTIGINTRDLKDFSLHWDIVPEILKEIPKDKIVICESGIRELRDLARIKKFKVNAVLVGEALMRASHPFQETKKFVDFLKKR